MVPGDPNERTNATRKGHIHKVQPMWKPKIGDMPPSQWKRRRRLLAKKAVVKQAKTAKENEIRMTCSGECGKMVMKTIGECRDCRRKRLLSGKRRMTNLYPKSNAQPKFETAKQKFDRVKKLVGIKVAP